MALASGGRLGAYDIIGLLGAGGMGEVYRARDSRLNRDVAIKILPELFADNQERLARFQREAQVLASLNHTNIAAIYGLEDSGGAHALVMELVEGPTLADRIGQGPIPLDEALPIASQIAEALEAAHEQGIIHRDLKPANIKVRPDGAVKVFDFGLAKLVNEASGSGLQASGISADLSQSPTITTPAMSQVGTILGTAAYMSPEQAKGRTADKRCDVWAFGCVLFEMLSGKRAFAGEDVSDTLAAVLRGEPDWAALPATTPAGVRKALRRCLEKDRKKRLHDIGDAAILIEDLATVEAAVPVGATVGRRRRESVAWGVAGVLLATVIALAVLLLRQPAVELPTVRFSVLPPEGVTLRLVGQGSLLSPDGRRIVFTGTRDGVSSLWVRELGSLEARPLAGTEDSASPFWSPDSRKIGFFANTAVKAVDLSGGPVRTLCAAPGLGRGGTWSRDGIVLFASAQSQGLFSVPDSGGQPVQVTTVSTAAIHRLPFFLPDGRRFLFSVFPDNEIRLGSLDSANTMKVGTTESQVEFVPPGYLLFVRQGVLVAQPFDADRGTLTGEFLPLVEKMEVNGIGYAPFSAAANGSLAYRGSSLETTQLTWVDRTGKPIGTVGQPGRYRNPLLSPDQSRIAVEITGEAGRNSDIWQIELARDVFSKFTFDQRNDLYPVWSPDGSRIAFGSDRESGVFKIYQKPANGSAPEEPIVNSENTVPFSWSPDGQFILARQMNNGSYNTGLLALAGDRKLRLFQPVPFAQVSPQVSPNGRWVAYQSNESGRYEVWVQTFPTPGAKWQVSTDGGYQAKWRGDGRELFYYAADGQLMSVPVERDTTFRWGPAVPLFRAEMLNGPAAAVGFRWQDDVMHDGKRFLLNMPVEDARSSPINLVLNWASALAKAR